MKKYWQAIIAFLLVILLNSISFPVYSQESNTGGNKIDGFPVVFANQTLFVIQADVSSFSSEERAETVTNRLEKIAEDSLNNDKTIIKISKILSDKRINTMDIFTLLLTYEIFSPLLKKRFAMLIATADSKF